MSAICGAVGTDGRPFTSEDLRPVLGVLAPLGRDGGGSWSGTAGGCGVAVAASLRRRTREDAGDAQPLISVDGSIVVVADVRIDNRRELAWALGVRDTIDVPDSAFVLAAYERWGRAMATRLHGAFAIAVVDRRRGGVLLVRDHAGTRPLVVHERRGVVAFASNALALADFDGVGRTLDVERVKEALALLFDSGRTYVEGVRWVPAATQVWIDEDGARDELWWDVDPHAVVDLGSPEAHADALRAALDDAVSSHLRTTGGIGAQVSGGLDSTSVAATAALQLAPETIRTYTSVPPNDFDLGAGARLADESPLVRDLVAMHPNLEPSFVDVKGAPLLEGRYEAAWELGAGPPRNPCNTLWLDAIDERAAADARSVLLSGAQGNLVYSADGRGWLAALARAGRYGDVAREVRTARRGPRHAIVHDLVAPLTPGLVRHAWSRRPGAPDHIGELLETSPLRRHVSSTLDLADRFAFVDRRRRLDIRAEVHLMPTMPGLADVEAARGARWGLDHRDPTFDRRVLDVGLAIPDWWRRRRGIERAVARDAMAGRLPDSIRLRHARGAQLPDWLDRMTDARPEIDAELAEVRRHDLSRSLLDVDRLTRLVGEWPDRARALDHEAVIAYRYALLRALTFSRYARWFEARAH